MAVDPERRLFRVVLGIALRDDDALDWLATVDGHLICALADVEPSYALKKVKAWQDRCAENEAVYKPSKT